MDSTTELKRRACAAIDASRDHIIGLGEEIMRNPETGFREFKTEARSLRRWRNWAFRLRGDLPLPAPNDVEVQLTAARRWHSSANWTACVFPITHLRTGDRRSARMRSQRTDRRHVGCGHSLIRGEVGEALGGTLHSSPCQPRR